METTKKNPKPPALFKDIADIQSEIISATKKLADLSIKDAHIAVLGECNVALMCMEVLVESLDVNKEGLNQTMRNILKNLKSSLNDLAAARSDLMASLWNREMVKIHFEQKSKEEKPNANQIN